MSEQNVTPQNVPPAAPAPEAPVAPAAPQAEPAPQVVLTAPPLPEGVKFIFGTGRRKKAVARVRIRPGSGTFLVNDRDVNTFFTEVEDRNSAYAPLQAANMVKSWDIYVRANGGGITGQAGAVMLGLARALIRAVPEVEAALRDRGLLTRDARMKERKKYGQKGARKRFQFSKR